jgi:hypothetical protein
MGTLVGWRDEVCTGKKRKRKWVTVYARLKGQMNMADHRVTSTM